MTDFITTRKTNTILQPTCGLCVFGVKEPDIAATHYEPGEEGPTRCCITGRIVDKRQPACDEDFAAAPI